MLKFLYLVVWVSGIVVISFSITCLPVKAASSDALESGLEKLHQGNYQSASLIFDEILKKHPKDVIVKQYRCFAYLNLEKYKSAITDCSDVIAEKTESLQAYLWQGLAHYRSHNYQQAIRNYNEILDLNPEHPQALYNRGLAFSAKGQFSQALVDYNQALNQKNTLSEKEQAAIYNDRGIVYLEQHRYEKARNDFSQAIQLDQNDSRSLYNLGCVCHYLGEHQTAIQHFTQSIQKSSNNASAYISRGLALHKLDETESAIADLKTGANLLQLQGKVQTEQEIRNLIWQVQHELNHKLIS